MDKYFQVKTLAHTPDPQQLIWLAMHQDYSSDPVYDGVKPDETVSGNRAVKNLLKGGRSHFGPFEHPQITFNVAGFPHSVMQQARTHRVGTSFDVQSFRYTGGHIADLGRSIDLWANNHGITPTLAYRTGQMVTYVMAYSDMVESIFYVRPAGTYQDRNSGRCVFSEEHRIMALADIAYAAYRYWEMVNGNMPYEMARGFVPFDYRQHFVVSFNMRSLMHFLDLRSKKDAQLEIRQMCDLLFDQFKGWAPEIAQWYEENRLHRGVLAP